MDTHSVLEVRYVVVFGDSCFVRYVQGYSPVEAKYKERQVVSDTQTCSQCNIVEELVERKLRIGTCFVFPHQPYVSGIEKQCSVQIASEKVGENAEAILQVGFQLDISRFVYVRIGCVFGRMKASGTDRTYRESTYAVGSSYVELFVIGSNGLVTVCQITPAISRPAICCLSLM